jgi:hypothetical protein
MGKVNQNLNKSLNITNTLKNKFAKATKIKSPSIKNFKTG